MFLTLKNWWAKNKTRRANNAAFWTVTKAYVYVQHLPCRTHAQDMAASDALNLLRLALIELEKSL